MKQKFQQVHLSELEPGDRFYFGTKKSEVCQFVKIRKDKRFGIPEYVWTLNGKKDSINKDRIVVFLRNINDLS